MMSMMGLGLSRTTAYLLSEKAVNPDMDQGLAQAWIHRQDLEQLDISPIAISEVHRVLG